jgi:hypothetical protein
MLLSTTIMAFLLCKDVGKINVLYFSYFLPYSVEHNHGDRFVVQAHGIYFLSTFRYYLEQL